MSEARQSVDLRWEKAAREHLEPFIGATLSPRDEVELTARTVRELLRDFPELRPSVIEGLLRRGETLNCIAAPKTGKSWLVLSLAMAVATGREWLSSFRTTRGRVRIYDNELHGEVTASRIPLVAEALGIPLQEIADTMEVVNLRGRLLDLHGLSQHFDSIPTGAFSVIVLDALYRFMPTGMGENDNGTIATMYNLIDRAASRIGCSFVLVHHTAKGSQSHKAVTDVGAGAGSQSRAADSHLVLREHKEEGVVVVAAETRSWPKLTPFCLRWNFPIWSREDTYDPKELRKPGTARNPVKKPNSTPGRQWTPKEFASEVVRANPRIKEDILADAQQRGISRCQAASLLKQAEEHRLVRREADGVNGSHRFSNQVLPDKPTDRPGGGGGSPSSTPPSTLLGGGVGGGALPPSPPLHGQKREITPQKEATP